MFFNGEKVLKDFLLPFIRQIKWHFHSMPDSEAVSPFAID
jgi:hypothetical protein